jgi:DNA-binding MarR family transcriptional regulator
VLKPASAHVRRQRLTKSVTTHIMFSMKQKHTTAFDIGSACVCLGVRRAARLVARRYDDALRPLGITSGQFSILAALMRDEAVPLGALADALGMDRTTLSRNLKPLEGGRLVVTMSDKADRRVRGLVLTDKGRKLLDHAVPLWLTAQVDSERRLAGTEWPILRTQLQALS